MEIEKKFLVRKLPENLTQYSVKHMEQGYLCTDPVLRIRKRNDRYILTYKSRIGLEGQEGVRVNQEIEAPRHKDGYEHLRSKVDCSLINNDR